MIRYISTNGYNPGDALSQQPVHPGSHGSYGAFGRRGAYGAYGFGPEYKDWVFGGRDRRKLANCPPDLRSEVERLRERWERGKVEWKTMSGPQKRASKDQGPGGLWADSRLWKEEAERLLAQCEASVAALDGGYGAQEDADALAQQTQQIDALLNSLNAPQVPAAGAGTSGVSAVGIAVPVAIAAIAVVGVGIYFATRK